MICDYQNVNYTITFDGRNESSIIELGPFHHRGSGTVKYDIVSDELIKGENYSVRFILSTSLSSVTSQNYSFGRFIPFRLSVAMYFTLNYTHA